MKLTNKIFSHQTMIAVGKLTMFTKYASMKTFFAMAKLRAEYEHAKQVFDYAEKALAMEYCDKDAAGNPILGPKQEFFFLQRGEEFQKRHDELMDQEIELNLDLITIKASEETKLFNNEDVCLKCQEKFKDEGRIIITPTDVAALFGIVEFVE